MSGYFHKFTSGFRKRWVPRFFVLRSHYLTYYVNDSQARVKGTLDLDDLLSVSLLAPEPTTAGEGGEGGGAAAAEGAGEGQAPASAAEPFTLVLTMDDNELRLRVVPPAAELSEHHDGTEVGRLNSEGETMKRWLDTLLPFATQQEE